MKSMKNSVKPQQQMIVSKTPTNATNQQQRIKLSKGIPRQDRSTSKIQSKADNKMRSGSSLSGSSTNRLANRVATFCGGSGSQIGSSPRQGVRSPQNKLSSRGGYQPANTRVRQEPFQEIKPSMRGPSQNRSNINQYASGAPRSLVTNNLKSPKNLGTTTSATTASLNKRARSPIHPEKSISLKKKVSSKHEKENEEFQSPIMSQQTPTNQKSNKMQPYVSKQTINLFKNNFT